ncbi:MAG: hypothetical protein AVDCRST_MAG05-1600 [uncultured Rubrobacteraceae bacterium]|uniref:Uncharacterized protein n=1 Tax=uncultured Rubrobacteraceae bacterium TaxID=349277 RepID=A0A6J4S043_9ACTN|nr:MAG: hypothetical protein AVDCRST_MAG05-1600 [uncultured Rubrobacteraceae bacterium]
MHPAHGVILYTDTLEGVSAGHLGGGFFDGWPDPPRRRRTCGCSRAATRLSWRSTVPASWVS